MQQLFDDFSFFTVIVCKIMNVLAVLFYLFVLTLLCWGECLN